MVSSLKNLLSTVTWALLSCPSLEKKDINFKKNYCLFKHILLQSFNIEHFDFKKVLSKNEIIFYLNILSDFIIVTFHLLYDFDHFIIKPQPKILHKHLQENGRTFVDIILISTDLKTFKFYYSKHISSKPPSKILLKSIKSHGYILNNIAEIDLICEY
jgi:hypothetical protein